MMKRLGLAMALGAVLGACGGGSSTQNAAAGRTFDYGAPSPASTAQATAVQGSVSGALALKASPDATQAQDLADFSAISAELLGGGVGAPVALREDAAGRTAAFVARRAGLPAQAVADFQNPACAVVTPTSVTLTGCQLTVVSGTTTTTARADGTFTVAADTVTWDLTLAVTVVDPAPSGVSATAHYHAAGTLTATATAARGSMRRELTASASAQGSSVRLGVSESLDLDLAWDPALSCVTGGTLEAKRVWTERPAGASASAVQDRAAKVTWTACGVATIQLSR